MDINIPFTDNLMADVIKVIEAADAGNLTTVVGCDGDADLKVVPPVEVHATQVAVLAHALSLTAARAQASEERFALEQSAKNTALQKNSLFIERMVDAVREMGSENDFCTRGMAGFVAQVLDIGEEQAMGYFQREYEATFTVTVYFTCNPGDEREIDLDLGYADADAPEAGDINSITWDLSDVVPN
jgi:hypothetical protein